MATSLQAEASSEEYKDPFCDKCYLESGRMIKVNAFCQMCNTFMCEGCETVHTDQESYMKHIILRGKDIPSCRKERPVCYNLCTSHDGRDLDQFCKDHSCLVCCECGRRSHRACVKEPVKAVSFKANEEEIGTLKTAFWKLKEEMLSSQEYVDTHLRSHLEVQRDIILKDCNSMFDELVAKIERLRKKVEAEVDALFDKQSKLLSEQVRDIEMAEKKYELGGENLFIAINSIVADINQCTDDFTKIQNSFEAVNLKFIGNDNLHKYIMKANSIGCLKICPLYLSIRSSARFEHIVFPKFSNRSHMRKPLKSRKKASAKHKYKT